PAKNEADGLSRILPALNAEYPDAEIIVVNDGSTDETEQVCNNYHVRQVKHLYSMGNGAAIKSGARHATREILVFMDADGQHLPEEINRLLTKLDEGFDMVVGARSSSSQATFGRLCANSFYNWFTSLIVGQKVEDLTSGFRAAKANKFREFLYLLPNGFSYPTTCTMAFFRAGYSIAYVSVDVKQRIGRS